MAERYSLAKISNELGVSKATVSLALSGKARGVGVSEELERRILDFCRMIDYRPNIHARRINSKLVKNIGIFLERMEEGATAEILSEIIMLFGRKGYRCSIQLHLPDQTAENAFEWLLNREVDGVIMHGITLPDSWRERIARESWPIVGIGTMPGCGIPVVNANDFEATFQLTKALIANGYREFHFMAGAQESYPSRERERGFRAAYEEAGFSAVDARIHPADFHPSCADHIAAELLENGKLLPGTAVVCASDGMAVGVLSAMRRKGFKAPRDFAVTGVNASESARIFSPQITTFEYLPREQGRCAAEMLLEWLEKGIVPETRVLCGRPVPGESAPI